MAKETDNTTEKKEVEIPENGQNGTPAEEQAAEEKQEEVKEPTLEDKIADLEARLEKEKKEYLSLMAEFDNFRKRTLKEKMEIMKNGAEKAMGDILPVIDDFERALQAMNGQTDVEGLKEGVEIIYNKFIKYLKDNGVEAIDSNKATFDTELHEAVANFPTQEEELKGKVIDTVQKGYMINDKVLRHAKVVVGQ